MSSITVLINGEKTTVEFTDGESILEVLRSAGIKLTAPCGGRGKCGKCRVEADGVSVLACKTPASDGMTVRAENEETGSIISAEITDVPFTAREGIGAAVDIGTTTLAVKLYDLSSGKELASKTAWNAQRAYGADVITRAQYTMEHKEGLDKLKSVIREQLAKMCDGADEVFAAGNTVMEHIASGISPASIAVAPYTPQTLFENGGDEENFKLSPCVAGYVGGDITAGIFAEGLHEKTEKNLFLDIGTNGEMALGGKDGFTACAVACGPAFEGAGISCGMQAVNGAVNAVRIENGKPVYDVIGGGEIKGICGSGLIDLAATLLKLEIIDETGRLLPPDEAPDGYEDILTEDENENGVFHLSDSVCLTAADVRQLQLAKSAVAAGIEVLAAGEGVSLSEIEHVYIAGGFGRYMNTESAIQIGMLPAEFRGKISCVGNSSLKGASAVVLCPQRFSELLKVKSLCRYRELSGDCEFAELFMERMLFEP